jgi:hypothetical protein
VSALDALVEATLATLPGAAAIAILDPLGECLSLARRGDAWTTPSAAARHASLPPLARVSAPPDAVWLRDLFASLAPQLDGASPVRALRAGDLELVVSDAIDEVWLVAALRSPHSMSRPRAGGRRRMERALAGLADALVDAGLGARR